MSMLSGSVLGPSGDGPRKRHPVATGAIVVLMMLVLFGATFGAVRLLRGSSTPDAAGPTAAPCVTSTASREITATWLKTAPAGFQHLVQPQTWLCAVCPFSATRTWLLPHRQCSVPPAKPGWLAAMPLSTAG